ncbi:MAG: hypothetical protein QOJ38_2031 [Solirubrobacterales bacterium]|nr:hypothetical protein [Solirubrobacterales bacterium]
MPGRKAPDPVLIGGTGRCGTRALASIVGQHSRYRRIHTECNFHCSPQALPGLLAGAVSMESFLEDLRGRWWERRNSYGKPSGLHRRIPRETLEAAIERFEPAFAADPEGASSRLIRDILDPIAEAARKPSWVEMSKHNVQAAPTLLGLLPDAKVIHIIRDGRDVASSVVALNWAPETMNEGVDWWQRRLSAAEQGAAAVPAERLLVLSFEDLVANDRRRSFERLLDFLAVPRLRRRHREPEIHAYFEEHFNLESANVSRWRKDLTADETQTLNAYFATVLEGLIAADTPGRPLFERFLDSANDAPARADAAAV